MDRGILMNVPLSEIPKSVKAIHQAAAQQLPPNPQHNETVYLKHIDKSVTPNMLFHMIFIYYEGKEWNVSVSEGIELPQ